MKTKEQIAKYNKEYFARPEVIARAKIRNSRPEIKLRRKLYKKTQKGRFAENLYRRRHYKKIADQKRFDRYGITIKEFSEMLDRQNGVCAICFIEKKEKLHIDHSHITNKVRGLLCGSCNRALGLLKDNPDILINAVNYLKRYV